jgi:hypothetical protein
VVNSGSPSTVAGMTNPLFERLVRSGEFALRLASTVIDRVEALPVSPQSLASKAIDQHFDRKKQRAATDPVWSDIEKRRHIPGSSHVVFRSEDLSADDWETQRRIETELTPDPWWLGAARQLSSVSIARVARGVMFVSQRARRGWDDRSTWDLGTHLTSTLAGQLDHLAATTHGWPDSPVFPTFEDWTATLRHQASQLRRYAGSTEQQEALDRWKAVNEKPGSDPEQVQAAWNTLERIEAGDRDAAVLAMHWVAEHLDRLWD